jgi:hypothetical protein
MDFNEEKEKKREGSEFKQRERVCSWMESDGGSKDRESDTLRQVQLSRTVRVEGEGGHSVDQSREVVLRTSFYRRVAVLNKL